MEGINQIIPCSSTDFSSFWRWLGLNGRSAGGQDSSVGTLKRLLSVEPAVLLFASRRERRPSAPKHYRSFCFKPSAPEPLAARHLPPAGGVVKHNSGQVFRGSAPWSFTTATAIANT